MAILWEVQALQKAAGIRFYLAVTGQYFDPFPRYLVPVFFSRLPKPLIISLVEFVVFVYVDRDVLTSGHFRGQNTDTQSEYLFFGWLYVFPLRASFHTLVHH